MAHCGASSSPDKTFRVFGDILSVAIHSLCASLSYNSNVVPGGSAKRDQRVHKREQQPNNIGKRRKTKANQYAQWSRVQKLVK
jgi:hypothetical protein